MSRTQITPVNLSPGGPNWSTTGSLSAVGNITSLSPIVGTSPNVGTTGGIVVKDAVNNPNAAYLQFVNNAFNAQYGYIQGLSAGGVNIGGNVGINTTTPNQALTVQGSISATGSVYFNDGSSQASAPIGSSVQSWQDVTSSRARNTTYTNSTNRPIMVNITSPQAASAGFYLVVNGVTVGSTTSSNAYYPVSTTSAIVPAGGTYNITTSQTPGFSNWYELR